MPLYSELYDDVYFSKNGGLDETRTVYLSGNNLPEAWMDKRRFCIAETGFGTGLNMLAAAKLFQQTAHSGQILDLVSVEKHPLPASQIASALSEWRDELAPFVDKLVDNYPQTTPGFHRLWLASNICLTLIFGDAAQSYAQVCTDVDSWFLDGFTPVKNPDMWSPELFAQVARLSHADTTLATFTVAAAVRAGLTDAGFVVEKRQGFNGKRHRLVGRFTGARPRPADKMRPRKVAIIGGGVAGAVTGHLLESHGIKTHLYEKEARTGTAGSGNLYGMMNMRILSPATPQAGFYTSAYDYARRLYLSTGLATVRPCPSIHLPHGKKYAQMEKALSEMNWPKDIVTQIDPMETADIAGAPIDSHAIVLKHSLSLSPQETVPFLAESCTDLSTGHEPDWAALDADVIVDARGALSPLIPLKPVRGQVCHLPPTPMSAGLKATLNFGGYFMPMHPMAGLHVLGATFDRGDDGTDVRDTDTAQLIQAARAHLPEPLLTASPVSGAKAGVRAATPDHFPAIGSVDNYVDKSVYISVGHGSHGLTSAPFAGEILLSEMLGITCPVGRDTLASLSPKRFI